MNDSNSQGLTAPCLLEAVNLHKSYKTSKQVLNVLSGTHLKLKAGEMLGIIGASGVGKSTLLHVLGGLDRPESGKVLFQGEDICVKGNGYLENFRNQRVGFVFQFFNLLSDFTALENAMFPALIGRVEEKEARELAEQLLVQMGLKDRLQHKPGELSGGESQRVALARGLINKPGLLLADEPTGNLDNKASDSLIELIQSLNSELGQTVVVVTHSQRIASKMDRVMELSGGLINPVEKSLII
ncbi:MAG: ABC transporter ATP-binding protein [Nitrospinaceae bacterium]|jgi:lipoprotein-releasing system ATP-binding protein|nr:ABC transporter ATP-binding protein [Nitrospinaceae bacterium]MDP6657934.1 ABC transporter ATP-binding protein [Nitrospinaceae bacterium]MDP6711161.1 ABC transporter ATP-binding protein [Nitrospinaceae bacterium]MDP7057194.1 ABC transporter ATP-binding protein [Nitrospinaceae bacterium]HAK38172.1 lipoprotein-releasing system ATP-binding protein LolD [Nitrospina sp.]|tara:strand:- start:2146 stop:2871 length:726 start_codon:yes stop_codon:yes gene_type:complete